MTPGRRLATLAVSVSERRFRILVCRGPECGDRRGSRAIYDAFRVALEPYGARCELTWQSCFGRCTQGPNCLVREITDAAPSRFAFAALPGPRGVTALYNRLDPVNVAEIVAEHIGRGTIVRHLIEPVPSLAPIAPATGDPSRGDP